MIVRQVPDSAPFPLQLRHVSPCHLAGGLHRRPGRAGGLRQWRGLARGVFCGDWAQKLGWFIMDLCIELPEVSKSGIYGWIYGMDLWMAMVNLLFHPMFTDLTLVDQQRWGLKRPIRNYINIQQAILVSSSKQERTSPTNYGELSKATRGPTKGSFKQHASQPV